jgi:DNA-directed RNA polymerase specialized sigma24 family protein
MSQAIDGLYLAWVRCPDEIHLDALLGVVYRETAMTFRNCDRDADDIASQVVVKVWRGMASYPHPDRLIAHDPTRGNFSAFVARIKKCTGLNYRRYDRLRPMADADMEFLVHGDSTLGDVMTAG